METASSRVDIHVLSQDHDNRELIKRVDPEFLPSYDAYKYPIQRADAVRYYILKHYGGIYVDLDMQANASFEPVFQEMERKQDSCTVFFGKSPAWTHKFDKFNNDCCKSHNIF